MSVTVAVIVGNRDFFPDRLVTEARQDVLKLFGELGIEPVMLPETEGKLGSVETWRDAQRCAKLFAKQRERIDGVLVTLPNFGDEKAVADTLRLSGLDVPVLIQAYPDELDQLSVERRRDAYCGKISVCNNLRQYGIPFTVTTLHTDTLLSDTFRRDFMEFLGVCRVVRGLRRARVGAVGARPDAFKTTRYSEKLLEAAGISVSTIDLSEVFARVSSLSDSDPRVEAKLQQIRAYAESSGVPGAALGRLARFAVVLEEWMEQNGLQATAIQCWTAMQRNLGVNCCAVMSVLSEKLMPSACEVDVTGAVSMYALQLASGRPSALADWNNNYGKDPDKCVLFHCGNWPRSLLCEPVLSTAPILGSILGVENTYGALAGRTPAGPVTFARVTTDDRAGRIRSYVAEGRFTDDPLETFGTRAVVEVPGLQKLMRYVCKNGFEHHVAVNASRSARILVEAFETYLGWDVYHHQA
jgi:L-fucose isomerase-like protein